MQRELLPVTLCVLYCRHGDQHAFGDGSVANHQRDWKSVRVLDNNWTRR